MLLLINKTEMSHLIPLYVIIVSLIFCFIGFRFKMTAYLHRFPVSRVYFNSILSECKLCESMGVMK